MSNSPRGAGEQLGQGGPASRRRTAATPPICSSRSRPTGSH